MIQEQVCGITKEGLVEGIGLLDAGPFLADVGLFAPTLTPGDDSVLADFTGAAPTFTGYALDTVTYGVVYDVNGYPVLQSGLATFTAATPLVANGDVGGVWVKTDGAKSSVYCSLDNPIAVTVAGQVINVVVRYRMNGTISVEVIS